ncbi:MAG: hypothetical protein AB7P76_02105 [Candidatus Melainabacteria bacterium]
MVFPINNFTMQINALPGQRISANFGSIGNASAQMMPQQAQFAVGDASGATGQMSSLMGMMQSMVSMMQQMMQTMQQMMSMMGQGLSSGFGGGFGGFGGGGSISNNFFGNVNMGEMVAPGVSSAGVNPFSGALATGQFGGMGGIGGFGGGGGFGTGSIGGVSGMPSFLGGIMSGIGMGGGFGGGGIGGLGGGLGGGIGGVGTTPQPLPANVANAAAQNEIALSPVNRNIDFTTLNTQQRTSLGLNDFERATVHLWGRAMISAGMNNGDIYHNVLEPGSGFTAAEKQMVTLWASQEGATFNADGTIANPQVITGRAMDEAFFAVNEKFNPGGNLSARYANRPVLHSTGQKINIVNDPAQLNAQQAANRAAVGLGNRGMNRFEQGVMRLWGHEPLMNGGKIDGSILAYTIANPNALDGQVHSNGFAMDDVAMTLLQADFMTDGTRNGDTLAAGFVDTMDFLYGVDSNQNGMLGTNEQVIIQQAQQMAATRAASTGVSLQQIFADASSGVQSALQVAKDTVANHPFETMAGVGTMAAAAAICPFLGGLAAAGAGIAAVNKAVQ